MDSTPEQRADFGAALARQLEGQNRARFAVAVADASGETVSENAITLWISGKSEPTRPKVFAMERVLHLRAGTLTRCLGYLPVDARPVVSVLDAVDADTNLTDMGKRILKASYRELTRG